MPCLASGLTSWWWHERLDQIPLPPVWIRLHGLYLTMVWHDWLVPQDWVVRCLCLPWSLGVKLFGVFHPAPVSLKIWQAWRIWPSNSLGEKMFLLDGLIRIECKATHVVRRKWGLKKKLLVPSQLSWIRDPLTVPNCLLYISCILENLYPLLCSHLSNEYLLLILNTSSEKKVVACSKLDSNMTRNCFTYWDVIRGRTDKKLASK